MRIIPILIIALLGCGNETKSKSEPEGPACPALSVTVDGEPVKDLNNALAVRTKDGANWAIQVYNHEQMTCEMALSGIRTPQRGEVFVRALVGATAHSHALAFDEHMESQVAMRMVKTPDKTGDLASVCISVPVSFTPASGFYAGRPVTVHGLIEGRYCGDQR